MMGLFTADEGENKETYKNVLLLVVLLINTWLYSLGGYYMFFRTSCGIGVMHTLIWSATTAKLVLLSKSSPMLSIS